MIAQARAEISEFRFMKGDLKCGFLLQRVFRVHTWADPEGREQRARTPSPQVAIKCYMFPLKYWYMYGPLREFLLDEGPYGPLSNT